MNSNKKLSLWDGIMIVSGSMIGSGIFIVSAGMTQAVYSPAWLLTMWVLTGFITIAAALSYGELAGMFPKAGGQYVYLKEASSHHRISLRLEFFYRHSNGNHRSGRSGIQQIHRLLYTHF